MPTSPRAEVLPLTGADCFLRAFDAETRRRNGASHLSQLVLRLGAGFDVEEFRRVLRQVVEVNPVLRAPVRRRFGVGAPHYALGRADRAPLPPVEVHAPGNVAAGGAPDLPALFMQRLNEARSARRGELLRVDVFRRGDAGTDLAFTWIHLLLDGAGSEQFVRFLEECRAGKRAPEDVPASDRPGRDEAAGLPSGQRERGAMAMAWQRRMTALGHMGVRSLAGPRRAARQDLVYDLLTHPEEESARIRERAGRLAGFLTPMLFYLAAAIRAHHSVLRRRRAVPESYVVPLPVNLRPKGAEGGMFRTRVSMVWFQVAAALADDLEALLAELKEQRRRAIREHQIENGVAAMDFARYAPARLYARMARRPLGGELCSFFFAYTDAFCAGLEHFFGAPVENGFHAPSVPVSPGSSLVFSLRDGRLNCTHVRQRDVLSGEELEHFRRALTGDLLGVAGVP